jgi:hypothetical protein
VTWNPPPVREGGVTPDDEALEVEGVGEGEEVEEAELEVLDDLWRGDPDEVFASGAAGADVEGGDVEEGEELRGGVGLGGEAGEGEGVAVPAGLDQEGAAGGLEDGGLADDLLAEEDGAGGEGGVAAEGHLGAWGEPAEGEGAVGEGPREGGLGDVHLGGEGLHPVVGALFIEEHDGGGVSAEGGPGEGIDVVEERGHPRIWRRRRSSSLRSL